MENNAQAACRVNRQTLSSYRDKLPQVAEQIISGCEDGTCHTHIDYDPLPSKEAVIDIIDRFRDILFPGYFNREKLDPVNIRYSMGQAVSGLFDVLCEQICRAIRHECFRRDRECAHCAEQGSETALALMADVSAIRRMLASDVSAAFDGDPAAKSHDEIIFSYPGIYAMTVYRVAHRLNELGAPLLPRMMTEHAHALTGIDIHPGAEIGERFVIDHGTGVVIGETTKIGNNVRIYQGVTLGALSLPKNAGERMRGQKRHPTIQDDVIIYSGATILGGDTVIGQNSVVGGNVWLTESIPPGTKVMLKTPELVYR